MYRRILVPVDGSSTAARGLREAIRLAADHRVHLHLVHVVDETAAVGAVDSGVDLDALFDGLVRYGRGVIERARRTAGKAGVKVDTALYESAAGTAAEAILREARKWRADLIVMGTHGRRGIRRLVMGSDAEQVLRRTTVPVLLVRANPPRRRG